TRVFPCISPSPQHRDTSSRHRAKISSRAFLSPTLRMFVPHTRKEMKMNVKAIFIAPAALLIWQGVAAAQDVAAGEKAFAKCRVCHQVGETAKNLVGPVLNGLVGRKAGSIEGYSYSDANKNSGLTWDE